MVDGKLLEVILQCAHPYATRLVFVGDPAQLPPVGPGAVLQELGQPGRLAALGEAAIELKTTYRNNGAIAAIAALLRPGLGNALLRPGLGNALLRPGLGSAPLRNGPGDGLPGPTDQEPGDSASAPISPPPASENAIGQTETLLAQLTSLGPADNLTWQRHPAGRLPAPALERLRQHQQRLQQLAEAIDWGSGDAGLDPTPPRSDSKTAANPIPGATPGAIAALLAELEACILLSPVRQGAWGVEAVHRQLLGEAAAKAIQHWPLGTPVLCQRNLAEEGLANGDIGVLVERASERLVLFPGPFPGQAGAALGASSPGARLFHPARLGSAEPALALTIHKSQGSQYQEVVLLVPETRHWDPRLLYTGLTRARHRAWLITTTAPNWLLVD